MFFSRYGGLWTDREDAHAIARSRLNSRQLSPEEFSQIETWITDGFVILKGAVPKRVTERLRQDLDRAFLGGDERLRIQYPGDPVGETLFPGVSKDRARVVDVFAFFESARQALFAEPIVAFLTKIFHEPPLLFQSLTFEKGSEQGMHQDTAYVVIDRPLELAASWIALEDIQPGSGELEYIVGSHRLPEYHFGGSRKHFDPSVDDDYQHNEWARGLEANSAKMGLQREKFLPSEGDVLVWAADLAHGGSSVSRPELSRRSLVGHYCPLSARPNYYNYAPERATQVEYAGGTFSSAHYTLDPS